jgi:hypothetical protein
MAFMGMLSFMIFPDVFAPQSFKALPVATTPSSSIREVEAARPEPPAQEIPITNTPAPIKSESPPRKTEIAIQPAPPFPEPQETPPLPRVTAPVIPPSKALVSSVVVRRASRGRIVFGKTSLLGSPPPERTLPLDPSCGALYQKPPATRFYEVSEDGALADVVVLITAGLPHTLWPPAERPLIIGARKCQFEPYVSAVQIGQPVILQNFDRRLHMFRVGGASGSRNRQWTFAAPENAPPAQIDFKEPEDFLRIRSDVDSWMFAYITVVPHPFFAVTESDGQFQIAGLPAGKYTLEARHRKAGNLKAEVTIGDDWSKEVTFAFVPTTEIAERR